MKMNADNNAVSYEVLWMTCGHSSHISIGTVIELLTGCAFDFAVLSNFRPECEQVPKDDSTDEACKKDHVCQNNAIKKAGGMCKLKLH